jgi:hypothetical protein
MIGGNMFAAMPELIRNLIIIILLILVLGVIGTHLGALITAAGVAVLVWLLYYAATSIQQ